MAEKIIIDCKLLSHSGGTKFYEVIQLHNVEAKSFVLVKRWGKNGVMVGGGGEVKTETFSDIRRCQAAAHKIVEEKKKGKPGQGEYAPTSANFGLHNLVGEFTHGQTYQAVKEHYGVVVAENLRQALRLGEAIVPVEIDDVIEEGPPAAPIDRGDAWGSW
ncbi:WGR domain-containing protein [Ralstonia pickettii]|uniref:WGR domain-containing protein n=1 Tax=Ralstonia pickettii TaxID=329 RepID=UPI0027152ABE|nr:WGR domain-containing protein [Ralstonia pickettii]WKZ86376.1 WGR domain-containing protein [Ralstonia pickettii]